jgi:hypothetical protein
MEPMRAGVASYRSRCDRAQGTHQMKYIAPIAVIAIWFIQYSGAVPESSVGGPITLAIVFFSATLAVGLHEAWTNKRGVLGWIVNIPVALVGGFLAAEVGNLIFPLILMLANSLGLLNLGGSLAATGGPLLYIGLAAMMLLMLLGSSIALQIVNRWR